MQIEVNGVKYEPKARGQKPQSGSSSKTMAMLSAMAMMYGGYSPQKSRPEPKIDIVKEYGLIQLKQSKLSARQRDWVQFKFEQTYKKVVE